MTYIDNTPPKDTKTPSSLTSSDKKEAADQDDTRANKLTEHTQESVEETLADLPPHVRAILRPPLTHVLPKDAEAAAKKDKRPPATLDRVPFTGDLSDMIEQMCVLSESDNDDGRCCAGNFRS